MLYILYGEDDFSKRQALTKIEENVSDELSAGANITYIDGSSVTLNEFKVACETIPFLAEKRMVVTYGLLGRFEPKEKQTSGRKSTKNKEGTKDWQPFAETINNIPDTTILALIDDEINIKNVLYSSVSEKAKVMKFQLLKFREVAQWVRERVSYSGGRISTAASELLSRLVGNDLWALSNEINKLIAYAADRMIEEKDVRAIVTHAQESNIFALLDAIMESKINTAQGLLLQALNNGMAPSYLLTMLARQLRLAILTKEMLLMRKTKGEIQTKLAMPDFAFQKTLQQADKYSMEQLKDFYFKLLDTDLSIKTGRYSEDLALNILVVGMAKH